MRSRGFVAAAMMAIMLAAASAAVEPVAGQQTAAKGNVTITPFAGAGVQFEYQGTVVHVDPWSRGDYSSAKPADLILITDVPNDHLDPSLIGKLRKPGAPVVMPIRPAEAKDDAARNRVTQVPDATVMKNGDRQTLAGVAIEAIPMYDIMPGEPFHAKGEANGYVITMGGNRIYLAGVTECVPEIKALKNIDIAFVPMNLPNGRMTLQAAADCVKIFRPTVVYPYHYREMPVIGFVDALKGEPIEVRLHDWYPPQKK